ncbi:MAG: hypothetical protein B9S26_01425 [Opitutia bacterium Tous-C4FEB]|nr:MAG: hypothetical protein B9S35_03080 [Opitutae bacterium Tous-C5TDCM]PAW91342.1 MAG: hypothetical protein B9S26_01425 [Opitutae bacterium Tous-C4FEB]
MPDGQEVTPAAAVSLPSALHGKVPKAAEAVAAELWRLNGKDRAQVFKAFNKLPPATTNSMMTSVQMTSWQGPLPPAAELERYNHVVPGGAERLFAMVEKQAEHRMQLENHVAREQVKQSGRGQIFALVIGVTGILSAATIGTMGHTAVAIAITTGSLGTLAVTFLVGKRQERTSRQAKTG